MIEDDALHWQIVDAITPAEAAARTADKVRMCQALASAGIPTPEVLGVLGDTLTAVELSKLLAVRGLFLKPRSGVSGRGAMRLEQGSDWLDGWIHGRGHIVQPLLTNHPDLVSPGRPLCTVRHYNFVDADGYRPAAPPLLKIGAPGAVVDSARCDGARVVDLSAGLVHVPHWAEVQELNERAALAFSGSPYTSTDIAVTPDGPVVVEVNTGGSFALSTLATGRPFLTSEAIAFFTTNGSSLSGPSFAAHGA